MPSGTANAFLLAMLKHLPFTGVVFWVVLLSMPPVRTNAVKLKKIVDTARKIGGVTRDVASTTWNVAHHTYRIGHKGYKLGKDIHGYVSERRRQEFEKARDRIAAFKDLANGNVNMQVLLGTELERHTGFGKLPAKATISGDDHQGNLYLDGSKKLKVPATQLARYYGLSERTTNDRILSADNAIDELKRFATMDPNGFYQEFGLHEGDNRDTWRSLFQRFDILGRARFKNLAGGAQVEIDSLSLALDHNGSYTELDPQKLIDPDQIPKGAKLAVFVVVKEKGILTPLSITDFVAGHKLSRL